MLQKQILVGGFFYSGSSAVVDYLRQFTDTQMFHKRESMIFRNGIKRLYEARRKNEYIFLKEKKDMFKRFTGVDDKTLYTSNFQRKQSIKLAQNLSREKISAIFGPYINKYPYDSFALFCLETKRFIKKYIDLASIEKELVIFDNDPKAYDGKLCNLYPNPYFIPVLRDPLDQWADIKKKKPKRFKSVEEFIEDINKKYVNFRKSLGCLPKDRVYPVYFESFVTSQSERFHVKNFVGVKGEIKRRKFYTNKSKRNVNIATGRLKKQEMIKIVKGAIL